MGLTEDSMMGFIRNFSGVGTTPPSCHKQYQESPSPLLLIVFCRWENSPLSLELTETAATTDKYVCQLLCISYYPRFIINSCFKSEVYVIVTNDCIALPVQKDYIHEC